MPCPGSSGRVAPERIAGCVATPRAHALSYAARVTHDTDQPPRDPRRAGDGLGAGWRDSLRLHRLAWVLASITVLLLVALLILFRRPLADRLWPETRAQALSDQAARALAAGRLSVADGSGARELYEAALAIDADRSEARDGLMRVAMAALAEARSATAADRYADAHRALQLARALAVPRTQADTVDTRLRQREAAHAGIERLLRQAAAARAAHRLDGSSDAALPLYQRVLALQPDRVVALEGREDVLSDLLQQARDAVQRRDLVTATRLLATARRYDPGHVEVPDTQARVSKALEDLHRHANAALASGHLQRAVDGYRGLIQVDPDDPAAQRGLEQVASAWAMRATRLAADFRFADANAALAQARALAPHAADVEDAGHAIARAQQAKGRIGARAPKAGRARRVRTLLAEANAAEARGDLLTPPGDSAFDKLRAARALAPDDAAVRRAGARLLPVAVACFDRELRGNNLGRANACLDARIALGGNASTIAGARRRLAQRWLAIGSERLGAGDLTGATSALAHARVLDPATPGVDDFSQRLQVAGAR